MRVCRPTNNMPRKHVGGKKEALERRNDIHSHSWKLLLCGESSIHSHLNSSVKSQITSSPICFIPVLKQRVAMESFQGAKYVRLRSHHDKYLCAGDDQTIVNQTRNGAHRNAIWEVEFIDGQSKIRLKSSYNRYLTATEMPFLLGWTGKKVLQTLPASSSDSSVEWEPIKERNSHILLKTKYGSYLRANGFTKPWKNRVTHDVPRRTITQYWVFWEVEVTYIHTISRSGSLSESSPSPLTSLSSRPSLTSQSGSGSGRVIYYAVGEDNGNIKDGYEWPCFTFKGNDMYSLKVKLEEESGLDDIIVCAYHPFTGKLFPLALDLPPNNVPLHLVLLQPSSEGLQRTD